MTESDSITTETDGNGVEIDQSGTIIEFNITAPERPTSGNDKGPALNGGEIFAIVLGAICEVCFLVCVFILYLVY